MRRRQRWRTKPTKKNPVAEWSEIGRALDSILNYGTVHGLCEVSGRKVYCVYPVCTRISHPQPIQCHKSTSHGNVCVFVALIAIFICFSRTDEANERTLIERFGERRDRAVDAMPSSHFRPKAEIEHLSTRRKDAVLYRIAGIAFECRCLSVLRFVCICMLSNSIDTNLTTTTTTTDGNITHHRYKHTHLDERGGAGRMELVVL